MKERKQLRKRNLPGVLFAIKVGGHHGHGSALTLLADAIEGFSFNGKSLGPTRSRDLAAYLIDELEVGYSASALAPEGNDAIRPSNQVGISPIRELERMLDSATKKASASASSPSPGVVGRQRGLAQALSFIRQPFSILQEGSGYHAKKIKEEIRASERRTKQ